MSRAGLLLLILIASSVAPVAADDAELERKIAALQAEIASLRAASDDAKVAELQRRLDLLAAELETVRTGGATEVEAPAKGEPGLGPAASKVYRKSRGVSIGGYGEALYQNFSAEHQDGSPSGESDRLDLQRVVLYTGYKWSDRILFNSEIEYEHATTGEGDEEKGEVSVEQAYLDLKPWDKAGFRAGMVLVPVGFINELHEPPVFFGARRPEVEQAIIPTTWHEVGAGLFGTAGPFEWRSYVVAGLSSAGFEGEGIREGRQQGSSSLAENVAFTGRLDYVGVPGLLLGGSVFTGNSGQDATVADRTFAARVTLFDVHAQYENRGAQLRALYAHTSVGDAARVNLSNGLEGDESVGSSQYGFYVEGAYDFMTLWPHGSWVVAPFVRYERLNTQDEVPFGYDRDPANDRTAVTAGVSVKPLAGVVLKADYQWLTNEARTGTNQFNVAVGFLF